MSAGWSAFLFRYVDCFVFPPQAVGFVITTSHERHKKQVLHLAASSRQICYVANCIVVIRKVIWWF